VSRLGEIGSRPARGRSSGSRSISPPEDGYARVEERLSLRHALVDAFDELPDHERRAVELHVIDGLPYDAVAERLAIRPAAARLRDLGGLPNQRDELQLRGVVVPGGPPP
jgi:DNA-directed RNA polymerase specialized sigma24 family protein